PLRRYSSVLSPASFSSAARLGLYLTEQQPTVSACRADWYSSIPPQFCQQRVGKLRCRLCNFSVGWRDPLHYAPVGAARAPAHHNLVLRSYHVIDRGADVEMGRPKGSHGLFYHG